MVLIGYSGHAFVVAGILQTAGLDVKYYCDIQEKQFNPFNLIYLGKENDLSAIEKMKSSGCFIAIGDNILRAKIFEQLAAAGVNPVNAVHPSAVISKMAILGNHGIMISAGSAINPLATIGNGTICNTGCIIEHECIVGEHVHIGPGAVLCGNVTIGSKSFVGAGAVIRQGITIGNNVMIGAGATVVKNVQDNARVMGTPAR